jgi:acyl-CoA synthetase (AMP-forming)/AMP-acid ligase II
MPLVCGIRSVLMQPVEWVARPISYLQAVARERGTLGWHPNFAYALIAAAATESDLLELDLSSLRGLVNCSEPVTSASQQLFLDRFDACGLRPDVFWGCYAMAETTFAVTHGRSSDAGYNDIRGPEELGPRADGPFVSVGRPLPGVELRVVDDDDADRGERQMGELLVRSPFNADRYHRNPDDTAASFRDGWYRTGDLGYTANGEVFVCGRKKDLMIVGGVNIHPHDVEELVANVPGVHPGRVAVFGDHDPATGTERVVVLAETDSTDDEERALVLAIRQRIVSAFLVTQLDVHLVPRGWLIKSTAGKMARAANRAKWRSARRAALEGARVVLLQDAAPLDASGDTGLRSPAWSAERPLLDSKARES